MKIVAVTQRVINYKLRNEIRDQLDQRLVSFLLVSGFVPVPVPNIINEDLKNWLQAVNPKCIVLSGGNDINEHEGRDQTEKTLLEQAELNNLPVLGICRGMQMMGIWAGVNLKPVKNHVRNRHRIMGKITGEVNSYHAFSIDECPKDFKVLARSEDGEIEAIRHRYLYWEGWMWHPEREKKFCSRDINQIKNLFNNED